MRQKLTSILFMLPLLMLLAACNDPVLDATSEETIKTSVEKMRAVMDEAGKEKLSSALQVLAFSQLDFGSIFAGKAAPEKMLQSSLQKYHGQTAKQIIASADGIIAERKKEQVKQAISEIAEIEEKIKGAQDSQDMLAKVEVVKSRFYKKKSSFTTQPVIDLTVKNGTDKAISHIYFEGVLASPNRSVPWLKDTFNYEIKGGLEPGETADWSLAPNMFSEWGETKAPKDAILTVRVTRLDDADGKEFANSEGASDETKERFEKLKKFVIDNQ